MKYENAKNLLPEQLLAELQKYASGRLIYVPAAEDAKAWGTVSGSRQKLLKRNHRIYHEYAHGSTIAELADKYYLSLDSIKKIVYGKKKELLPFSRTLESAEQYADAGLAEEWIDTYYQVTGRKHELAERYVCVGVVRLPMRLIDVCFADGSLRQDRTMSEETACDCDEETKCDEVTEPLLVRYKDNGFYLDAQEILYQQLRNKKIKLYPVFILIESKEEYGEYMQCFGKYFL